MSVVLLLELLSEDTDEELPDGFDDESTADDAEGGLTLVAPGAVLVPAAVAAAPGAPALLGNRKLILAAVGKLR